MTPASPPQADCLDYLDEPDRQPRGAELVRIRTELVAICREHCGPETVALAEESLARAIRGESPWRMRQLELFGEVA